MITWIFLTLQKGTWLYGPLYTIVQTVDRLKCPAQLPALELIFPSLPLSPGTLLYI